MLMNPMAEDQKASMKKNLRLRLNGAAFGIFLYCSAAGARSWWQSRASFELVRSKLTTFLGHSSG